MTNSRLVFKTLFYLTAIAIAFLSLVSLNFNKTEQIGGLSFRLDYLFHFAAYFCLALFLVLWQCKRFAQKKFLVSALLFGLVFSILFELIQIILPNRVFNPLDVLFNSLGFLRLGAFRCARYETNEA